MHQQYHQNQQQGQDKTLSKAQRTRVEFIPTIYEAIFKEGWLRQTDEFSERCQRRGGHFNPKFYVADFGNFKQVF